MAQKREIIGSIFAEKLCFDGLNYRTAKLNEAVELIFLINKEIGGKKMGQVLIFRACPMR